MNSIPNYILRKNNTLGIRPKKKSIPININTNPTPGKFIFSNQINKITSSYLSMGQKIHSKKNSKLIHVNTNSATNYYSINDKDKKQSYSLTNSIYNNFKNNNKSENIYNNFTNNQISQIYETNSNEKNSIKFNNININSNNKKQLSTSSNSRLSNNEFLVNGFQRTKNKINNSKLKTKEKSISSTYTLSNFSKNKQIHSTRPNCLDSRNKTRKVPMKSKLRQYKYQIKNSKPASSSFYNAYVTKSRFKEASHSREKYKYVRDELLNNLSSEKKIENIYIKNKNNSLFIFFVYV